MTEIQDDRTPEQRETHTLLAVGTDSFMSGWGGARNGASYAAWAATPENASACLAWVESRGDMKRVREVYDPPTAPYRPGPHCAHLHVYVWER